MNAITITHRIKFAQRVITSLEREKFTLIDDTFYSKDLRPTDFRMSFELPPSLCLCKAITLIFENITRSEILKSFEKENGMELRKALKIEYFVLLFH